MTVELHWVCDTCGEDVQPPEKMPKWNPQTPEEAEALRQAYRESDEYKRVQEHDKKHPFDETGIMWGSVGMTDEEYADYKAGKFDLIAFLEAKYGGHPSQTLLLPRIKKTMEAYKELFQGELDNGDDGTPPS